MKRIDFVIRQKGKHSKYCYFRTCGRNKFYGWTKKLSEADCFLDAYAAFDFKDKLKFNNPRVIGVVRNGNDKIVETFKPTRKKYAPLIKERLWKINKVIG